MPHVARRQFVTVVKLHAGAEQNPEPCAAVLGLHRGREPRHDARALAFAGQRLKDRHHEPGVHVARIRTWIEIVHDRVVRDAQRSSRSALTSERALGGKGAGVGAVASTKPRVRRRQADERVHARGPQALDFAEQFARAVVLAAQIRERRAKAEECREPLVVAAGACKVDAAAHPLPRRVDSPSLPRHLGRRDHRRERVGGLCRARECVDRAAKLRDRFVIIPGHAVRRCEQLPSPALEHRIASLAIEECERGSHCARCSLGAPRGEPAAREP